MFRQLLCLRAAWAGRFVVCHRWRRAIGMLWTAVTVGAVMAAVAWIVRSSIESRHPQLNVLLLPGAVVLLIALIILRNERRWHRPARRLRELLPQVANGDVPIEELSQIGGGLNGVTSIIQNLVRELRQQKTHLAILQQEMSQRVANRTTALERQIGSLRQQAVRDPLTGLFNRRMLDTYLPEIGQRCMNEKCDLSLLVLDLDNFKLLNDGLGHAAGDDLLRDLGGIIRSGVRDADAAFRIGGDEFVIVMPGANPAAADALANRLDDLLAALVKPLRLQHPPRLSFGRISLSELPGVSKSQELLELADQRLYQMKAIRHRARPMAKAG